jgi:23S rRNA pseudouridine2457 synthase
MGKQSNHRFLDPEQGHPRACRVQVEGEPNEAAVKKLKSGGVNIQGHRTRPCRVELLENEPNVPPPSYKKATIRLWMI